jgi:hypothetical protein
MTTNILAPFVKLDESFQFYVSGRLFEMNETEIKEVEGTQNSTLINAINAFESFQFTEDSVRWFHGPSKFIYNLAEGIFQHNNSEIIGSTFSNHIMAAGHIRYAEKPIAELFESLPTLLENFVTLDFAATFEGNNTTVNLFVLNENVYVARNNHSNKIAKFFKSNSANEAADYVNKETGESALLFLKEMVEGESAELAIKEEKLQTYESMISFLKDQKGLLANADRNDEAIKEAESLINGEIRSWEDKIAFINEKLNLSSEKFAQYIKDVVSKKCPWAEITSEENVEKNPKSTMGGSGSIIFDYAVKIYWQEGPENVTSSMIGVSSKGRFQKIGLDPNNPNRPKVGEEVQKTTAWKNQDGGVATLIKTLKSNSSNSPQNN